MSRLVTTITLNPCLDRILVLDQLQLGTINHLTRSQTVVGGKGINVARMLALLGVESVATGFLGGNTGNLIKQALDSGKITHDFINCTYESRTNTKVITGKEQTHQQVTELNESGPQITSDECQHLSELVTKYAKMSAYLVFSGSLPPGCPDDFYQNLMRQVMIANPKVKVVLDTSGAALVAGLHSKPFMIKPNRDELSQICGLALNNVSDVIKQCSRIQNQGIEIVVCSLGAAGIIAITEHERIWMRIPPITPKNTVGCGDAVVAGMIAALVKKQDLSQVLQSGVTAGTIAALDPGIGFCSLANWDNFYQQVEVQQI